MLEYYINKYNLFFLKNKKYRATLYNKGDFLINSGEKNDCIIIIADGKVEVSSTTLSGKKVYVNMVEGLDVIGDIEYLVDGAAQFDCYALTQVTAICISFKDIERDFVHDVDFWKFLALKSSGKLHKSNQNMLIKNNYNCENLIATYLHKHNGEIRYKRLEEVSEYFGVSYRQLLRVIKKLEEIGGIFRLKGIIRVSDWDIIGKLRVED